VTEQKLKSRSARGSKRTRVLVVAARILNRIGVSSVSLPAIAEELGVSRAALYYYFADQEDLVFQSYRRSCEILAQHLGDAIDAGGDALSIIDSFIDRVLAPDSAEIASISDMVLSSAEN
jgi:AcrR family transcriptional regulator